MRTPDRDRCGSAIFACCLALVVALACIPAAGALSADYQVFPNGTAYRVSIEITDAARYAFADTGFMGESVPLAVGGVRLLKNGTEVSYNQSKPFGQPSSITFERGNYTVEYTAPLQDNHLQGTFEKAYQVTITIPQEFDVRNPLLAGLSMGANTTRFADNTTLVQWNKVYSFDLRFYEKDREDLLYFFLQFMGILIFVLVVIPYIMSMRREE
jgi:hypothetical protein